MSRTHVKSYFLSSLAIVGIVMGLPAFAQEATTTLQRIGRIRNFDVTVPLMKDLLDRDIYSPKSVHFSKDGKKFYINSLEGGATVVYAWPEIKKLKTIYHRFTAKNSSLFRQNENTIFDYPYYQTRDNPNEFTGKPVESALSPDGKYLWISYYRRNFDESAQSPSAVAIIDTQTDQIVRVMPTGPIPKYIALSPDGKYAAIVHWGDNTVGLIDTKSSNPFDYQYIGHMTVEHQLSQQGLEGKDRDSACGFCLRGAVFDETSKYLLVARMGGGGIAGFDIETQTYLGSIMNIAPTPRHLIIKHSSQELLVSSNTSGVVSKASITTILQTLELAHGKRVYRGVSWSAKDLGKGARTLALSSDEKFVFVAMRDDQAISMISSESLEELGRIKVDPYPVGLAVHPFDPALIVTSQGSGGQGGNSVNIIAYTHLSGQSLPQTGISSTP